MTIQEPVNRLDAEFQETPLGFTVETALQAQLLELLRAKVRGVDSGTWWLQHGRCD